MKVTQSQIKQLAELHVRLFQNRLSPYYNGPGRVNVRECEHYLDLWSSIGRTHVKDLDARQKQELYEAIYCGDYERIVKLPEDWDGELEFIDDPEAERISGTGVARRCRLCGNYNDPEKRECTRCRQPL